MRQRSSSDHKHGLLSAVVRQTAARSGLTFSLSDGPATLLGKRDAEGSLKKPVSNNRAASRFRGVTHHCRTNRYESHIWESGKQVYLGGYYSEPTAALAYDLAAIKFRGDEAITNFDLALYRQELETSDQVSRDEVVQGLRSQSKAMNSVDMGVSEGSQALRMDDWELLLSSLVQADKEHLGVFATEVDAARAVDRALIARRGIDSFAACNYALVEYMDLLTPQQVQEGISRNLLPPTLPVTYAPTPMPQPCLLVHAAVPRVRTTGRGSIPGSSAGGTFSGPAAQQQQLICASEGCSPDTAAAAPAQVQQQAQQQAQQPVLRRKSTTPRSVLDFLDEGARHFMESGHAELAEDLLAALGGQTGKIAGPVKRLKRHSSSSDAGDCTAAECGQGSWLSPVTTE